MSVTLEEAKRFMRVSGSDSDTTIEDILARAIQEAEDYMDNDLSDITSSSEPDLPESIKTGILLLAQAQWSGDLKGDLKMAAHSRLDYYKSAASIIT